MRTEQEIKQEIEYLEQKALERIKDGYATLKYALVYRLQALRWVLEKSEISNSPTASSQSSDNLIDINREADASPNSPHIDNTNKEEANFS